MHGWHTRLLSLSMMKKKNDRQKTLRTVCGCALKGGRTPDAKRSAPRRATDLALRTTKATALAIGRSMSSLIVLEHHLWLTMTEMKEADKVPFRDAPVLSGSLFGSAVERFAERLSSEVVSAGATLP